MLKFDKAETDTVANQINAAADDFTGEVDRIIGVVKGMEWSGVAKDAYVEGLEGMKTQFTQMVEGTIRAQSEKMRQGGETLDTTEQTLAQGYRT